MPCVTPTATPPAVSVLLPTGVKTIAAKFVPCPAVFEGSVRVDAPHTGRLRRVYQRFALMREEYHGLYWSHFQAALDWDDAEMWLEGAVQKPLVDLADAGRAVANARRACGRERRGNGGRSRRRRQAVSGRSAAAGEFGLDGRSPRDGEAVDTDLSETAGGSVPFETTDSDSGDEPAPIRPFENLPNLPADLRDAFDGFKLAIIHHRLSNWQEVGLEDVLATLEALRQLALAPAKAKEC